MSSFSFCSFLASSSAFFFLSASSSSCFAADSSFSLSAISFASVFSFSISASISLFISEGVCPFKESASSCGPAIGTPPGPRRLEPSKVLECKLLEACVFLFEDFLSLDLPSLEFFPFDERLSFLSLSYSPVEPLFDAPSLLLFDPPFPILDDSLDFLFFLEPLS